MTEPAAIPLDLDWLTALHTDKGIYLITSDRSGFVYLAEENPIDAATAATTKAACAYVTELIRLARIGQRLEQASAEAVARGDGRPVRP